jgi:hypothetical protein
MKNTNLANNIEWSQKFTIGKRLLEVKLVNIKNPINEISTIENYLWGIEYNNKELWHFYDYMKINWGKGHVEVRFLT